MRREGIQVNQLVRLTENAGVKQITFHGTDEGLYVVVNTIAGEKELFTQRGKRRMFKKLETVSNFLRQVTGIDQARLVFDFDQK